jgi:hypothetical protein
MEIESYMIKPLQRICKYPLLLQELIKVTPYDSSEHSKLTQIEHKIREIVKEINETQRRLDTLTKLSEIQSLFNEKKMVKSVFKLKLKLKSVDVMNSNRYVMKDGILNVLNTNKVDKIYVYLLNDMMLVVEEKGAKKVLLEVFLEVRSVDYLELKGSKEFSWF